ncbi:MAG: ferredoxin [Candidatus Portnoybacteria bacterium]|nr:ferredoxin [Candidatus Portnoybacteria bacterium]
MRIILERSQCIGCGSCAAICPAFFEMAEDGLSHLKNAIKNTERIGIEELEVLDPGCCKDAADICPVQVIKIQ